MFRFLGINGQTKNVWMYGPHVNIYTYLLKLRYLKIVLHKITNIPLCILGKPEKNPCCISVGGRAPHSITLNHCALQTQHKLA